MSLYLFAVGSVTLEVRGAQSRAVLELCLHESLSYVDFARVADGIRFRVSLPTARRLERACRRCGLPFPTRREAHGLPILLLRILHRPGLLVGGILSLCLLIASTFFVWDVRVSGNVTLRESEVVEALRACGFGVGSYLPTVRTGEIEQRVPMQSERIAWMALYLDGTVARVQIIESVQAPTDPDKGKPANLVASRDGQIEYCEILRGERVVIHGQAVKKGDLLVSGVYDDNGAGFRYTRAAGRVLARTEHTFSVRIPLTESQKTYGEPTLVGLTLKFFDFSVKIFENSGNATGMCDIIETEMNNDLAGRYPLPVFWVAAYAYPYTEVVCTRTAEEAVRLAYAALERQLASLSEGVELLAKHIQTRMEEDAVELVCVVECIEDIAQPLAFEVIEQP